MNQNGTKENDKERPVAIGADIGGSHISCTAVDLTSHRIIDDTHVSMKVDNKAQADTIIRLWCEGIKGSMNKAGIEIPAGIGLAMPGPFDYLEGIALFEGVGKFDHLNGVDVRGAILETLQFPGDVPVRFMNDATSFAVGEVWSVPGMDNRHVLALTLGTGFGSAFIFDSLPVITDPRVPEMGCLYHLPYKDGTADDTFSTRGMIAVYLERSGHSVNGIREIALRAGSDPAAMETFRQFGSELAAFLSPWIRKASVTDIIMGGNVVRSYELFRESFEKVFEENKIEVQIRLSADTELSAILGSARLAEEDYWTRVKPLIKDM